MPLNPEASLGSAGDSPVGEGNWLVCETLSHLDINSQSEAMREKGSGLKVRSKRLFLSYFTVLSFTFLRELLRLHSIRAIRVHVL